MTNKELLINYVRVASELEYIDEYEPQYIDEAPNEYAALVESEYRLRMTILNKMESET